MFQKGSNPERDADDYKWVHIDEYNTLSVKCAALQSEIEAMTAGAEGYKRRIADLEAEKVVSGWDPSRPRYVASLSSGPDKRPTMMELRLLRVEDADTLRFGEIITEVHVTVRRLRRR
jgi:hypothetical protein